MSNKKNEITNKDIVGGVIIGLVIGFMVGGLWFEGTYKDEMEQLGEAICEEEKDAVFVSYKDGKLECQENVDVKRYDGIKIIEIGK